MTVRSSVITEYCKQNAIINPHNKSKALLQGREIEIRNRNTVRGMLGAVTAGFLSFQNNEEITFEKLVSNTTKFDRVICDPRLSNLPNRIEKIAKNDEKIRQEIINHAKQTHPFIHEKVLGLTIDFLSHKRTYGTDIERHLYKNMAITEFLDRLLKKRPIVFMNSDDYHILRDGTEGDGGFENIGTNLESEPLVLEDYLSYDEMLLSAFINVSLPTYFINDGNKYNLAIEGVRGTFEEKGICTALVGTRLEKPGYMEWQHIVITKAQNTTANGYGLYADPNNPKTKLLELWATFYNQKLRERYCFPAFEEARDDKTGKYIQLSPSMYFNADVYKQRLRATIEAYLIDADERAKAQGVQGYVMAEGIGLGVWRLAAFQNKLMLEVYADILKEMEFPHLDTINLEIIVDGVDENRIHFLQYCKKIGLKTNCEFDFEKREHSAKLTGKHENKVLIRSYAWDGNSYPGNEFWVYALSASGDPATASSTTISQLQNPEINPMVSGKNVYIMAPTYLKA